MKKFTDYLSEADNKKLLQELGLMGILDRKELVIFLKDNLLFKEFSGDGERGKPKSVIRRFYTNFTHYENYYYRISDEYSRSIDWWYDRLCVLLTLLWNDVKISG